MEKTLKKIIFITMQNGNTTNSSDDTPTYPWSSFFSGHPPTVDELPHRPIVIAGGRPNPGGFGRGLAGVGVGVAWV